MGLPKWTHVCIICIQCNYHIGTEKEIVEGYLVQGSFTFI